jgi:hypothetical protein
MSHTLIQLSDDFRVRPLDHLQWVLERRSVRGGGRWKDQASHLKHDGEHWLPYAYCRTKAGLETALSRLKADGVVLDVGLLAHLPDHFDGPPADVNSSPTPMAEAAE